MTRLFYRAAACCLLWGSIAAPLARAQQTEKAHFHHVVINAVDPAKSIRYYNRVFGATPVKFRGVSDALYVEKSFILFNKVDQPANSALDTGIWHIGWGGVDIQKEFEWWKGHDVEFHTPVTRYGDDLYYMYIYGPDKELIEVNTMGHHRFGHVHFYCADPIATADWYAKHFGQVVTLRDGSPPPTATSAPAGGAPAAGARNTNRYIMCDNVFMIFYSAPRGRELQSTKDHAIDRLGVSYRSLEPVYERMKAAGVKILEPIADRPQFKFKSFVVEGPDKVNIEIVESKPVPEGIWESSRRSVGAQSPLGRARGDQS